MRATSRRPPDPARCRPSSARGSPCCLRAPTATTLAVVSSSQCEQARQDLHAPTPCRRAATTRSSKPVDGEPAAQFRKRRLVAGRDGGAEKQPDVRRVLLQREVLAREQRGRVPHRDRRRAQARLPRAGAASSPRRRPTASSASSSRRAAAASAASMPDAARMRRTRSAAETVLRARASAHAASPARAGVPQAARASPRDPGRARGRGRGTRRRRRVAIAQGEVAFGRGGANAARSGAAGPASSSGGEQPSRALQAARPGHRGCEADRPRESCAALQHGEAVAAGSREVAEQQGDVCALHARSRPSPGSA